MRQINDELSWEAATLQHMFLMLGVKRLFKDYDSVRKFSTSMVATKGFPTPGFIKQKYKYKKLDLTGYKSYQECDGKDVWKCFQVSPKHGTPSSKALIYLHGGGFILDILRQQWHFIGRLVDSLQCTIYVMRYPWAPKHTYKDTHDVLLDIYKYILSQYSPNDIWLMGLSSGAQIGLAFALYLKEHNVPQPKDIILISPGLDVSLSSPEITEKMEKSDIFLQRKGATAVGVLWALGLNGIDEDGSTSRQAYDRIVKEGKHQTQAGNYLLYPMEGDLSGLGKITIFVGGRDILMPDGRSLQKKLEENQIESNYFEYTNMCHAFITFNKLKESQHALNEIVQVLVKD